MDKRLKAGFFGCGGNSWLVKDYLKDTIEKAGYEIVICSEWDDADVAWDIDTWPDEMSKCDVVLCPQRVEVQPAKSNVKATTAMALGMPVLASPIQSYMEVIRHKENGYICGTFQDWHDALVELKDPEKRKKIGEEARKSIGFYTLDQITKDWVKVLDDLINDRLIFESDKKPADTQKDDKNRDLVDIIIQTYNNVDYVKMCVSSVLLNTIHPYHIIISDGGSDKETWEYLNTLKGMTILGKEGERKNFSETANAGIEASSSKFFVLLNSDLIVSKGWLTNLVKKMTTVDRLAACGVLSNCDRGWLHDNPRMPDGPKYPMKLEKAGIELYPGMKMEQIKPHIEELYEFMAKSNEVHADKYTRQPWVAAYATMFARSAINEVGMFDTSYHNGCEDLDLMLRLSEFGYAVGQAIDSFVFHFGGKSRKAYENELDELERNNASNN